MWKHKILDKSRWCYLKKIFIIFSVYLTGGSSLLGSLYSGSVYSLILQSHQTNPLYQYPQNPQEEYHLQLNNQCYNSRTENQK